MIAPADQARIVQAQESLEAAICHMEWMLRDVWGSSAAQRLQESIRLSWSALGHAKQAAAVLDV